MPEEIKKTKISDYLHEMVMQDASDLYITVGYPVSLRTNDKITAIENKLAEIKDVEEIVDELLDEGKRSEFHTTLELNTAIEKYHNKRFRANFFYQQHKPGIVIRRIKTIIPTLESLGLPDVFKNMVMERRGLVLMVGASGSGKSTSLAAMLGHRNTHGSGHIITVEDPIEFIHTQQNCIFTQREIGIDTYSYQIALKNALRQTPDVIVIGEIRDRETMEQALLFCETGHLCLATLHANNSNQTIERIINLFPEDIHKQIQLTLSQNLKAIISQRLVANIKGGRALATEILLNVGLIKQLIEEGKIKEIKDIIEKNRDQGMHSFDQSLVDLFLKGIISEDMAIRESDNNANIKLKINQEKTINPLLKKTSYASSGNNPPPPMSEPIRYPPQQIVAQPKPPRKPDVDTDF